MSWNKLRAFRCLLLILFWVSLPMLGEARGSGEKYLRVIGSDQAERLRLPLPDSGRWCLVWHHSVQGFQVKDCFRTVRGHMVLDSTQTPDFAAGLGYIPGRGVLKSSDNHGYRIVNMKRRIPGDSLVLRVGSFQVNHRILTSERTVSLSRLAAHERVQIRLANVK